MLYRKGVLGQKSEVRIRSSFHVVAEALLANDTKGLSPFWLDYAALLLFIFRSLLMLPLLLLQLCFGWYLQSLLPLWFEVMLAY